MGARVHFSEVVEEARVEFGAESVAGCSQRVGGGAVSSPVPKKGPRPFSIAASPSSLPPKKRILLTMTLLLVRLESDDQPGQSARRSRRKTKSPPKFEGSIKFR